MTLAVKVTQVSKQYPLHQVNAVRHLSMTVSPGEFVALMGPSGCGKSTLLNLIGGMDKPTSGEIWVGQQQLSQLNDEALTLYRQKQVGFVFQFFNLLPTLTVQENVMLPLSLAGMPRISAIQSTQLLLQNLGLSSYFDFYPAQLSGGQMQRVAIARAVIHQPGLLIADEPTGNLDSENGQLVLETLKNQVKQHGQTLLMATHSPKAAAFADRCLTMRDGKLVTQTTL